MPATLLRHFPLLADLPVAGIAHLPTPITDLPLAGVPGARVKRDDLTSPAYGGNKVRKLDLLLGDALARGARTVLTFGAYGSNHALATAVHARALGLEPHAVLSPQEPGPYAPATLLAHAGLGTVIHLVDGWDGRRAAVEAIRELRGRDGAEPCVIPMGGTDALGAVGYVDAAFEIAEQTAGDEPDALYLAAGTLGTAVGLAVGLAAAGLHTRVVAVRVTPIEICNEEIAARLVDETVRLLRAHDPGFPALSPDRVALDLRHDHAGPGYGVVTPASAAAVAAAREAGIGLETTYTGRALSALISDTREGAGPRRPLFLDTYSSAPMPAPGPREALPPALREYLTACEALPRP